MSHTLKVELSDLLASFFPFHRMASQIARRLVILGAPGSGKGTIASRIVKSYGVPHIVVGDILRQHIQRKSGNEF